MKLKELLETVEFEDMIEPLVSFDPKAGECLDAYKEAFDILRHTEAKETDRVISVEWVELSSGERYIKPRHCEGDWWDRNLGKEIVVAENVNISMEDVAARILWSLTFYGFNLKEQEEFGNYLSLCHFMSESMPTFAEDKQQK